MRILLTGGTGFLGLALTERLLAEGHSVDVLAPELPAPWMCAALQRGARYHTGDVRDADTVARVMQETGTELVIHAAAATPDAEREAAGNAAEIVAINIGGTATVIEQAALCGVRRVMALSSVAVYGRSLAKAEILVESMPPQPQNLYAISKSSAEALALRLGAVHRIPVLTPRVGVLWGQWEHRSGQRATPSPAFCMVELARRGEDMHLPFAATAPLCHVETACEMLAALVTAPWEGGIVNLGADRSVDLIDFAEAVARQFGVSADVDANRANVPFFAVDRPPMALERLQHLTGRSFAAPDFRTQLQGYADWLAGLEHDGAAPCPAF